VPVGHPNFGKAFRCTCQLDDLQSRQLDRLRRLSNMHHLERMTFDSFILKARGEPKKQRKSLRIAYEKAVAFARKPEGWLLLRGSYGCGKTHLRQPSPTNVSRAGSRCSLSTCPTCSTICAQRTAPTLR